MDEMFQKLNMIESYTLRLSFLKEILEDMSVVEVRLFLRKYIQYEKRRQTFLLTEKNRFTKLGDYENASLYSRKFKDVKNYIQDLRNFSREFVVESSVEVSHDDPKSNLVVEKRFPISRDRILAFDQFCGSDFVSKIPSFLDETNSLKTLKNMKEVCLKSQKLLKREYRRARLSNDSEALRLVTELKHTKVQLLYLIDQAISVANILKKQEERKEETYEDVFGKETVTESQISIIDKIVNHFNVSDESLDDLVVALKLVLQNYPFREVIDSVCDILNVISSANLHPDSREFYYLSILDTLKSVKKKLGEQEKQEKREISQMIQRIENEILILDKTFFCEEEDFDYQVIEYCLNNQIPYYHLKKMFSTKPSLIDLEKDEKAVVVSVLEKYIESQKVELRNQKRDYIHKEYYKHFYELLRSLKCEPFSVKVEKDILKLKEDFLEYLENSGYKTENKNDAVLALERLLNPVSNNSYFDSSFSVSDTTENLKGLTEYLVHSKNRVSFDQSNLFDISKRIETYQEQFYEQYGTYPNDTMVRDELSISPTDYLQAVYGGSTVSFLNNHVAFSIRQNGKGSYYLYMHVFDLTAYIHEGDLLEGYLYEHVNEKFKNRFLYKKGTSVPSVTYQIKLFPDGNIGELKIYPSVVNVKETYSSLDNYRDDPVLKSYVAISKRMGSGPVENLFELEQFFKEYFLKRVVKLSKKNSIPTIFSGKSFPDQKTLMHIQSDLGPIFSKMDKSQFQFYSQILRNSLDEEHYVNSNLDDGVYTLKLDSPSSYVDLMNQRMLLSWERFSEDSSYRETWKEKSDEVILYANTKLGYVEDEKKKAGRVKKKCVSF